MLNSTLLKLLLLNLKFLNTKKVTKEEYKQ